MPITLSNLLGYGAKNNNDKFGSVENLLIDNVKIKQSIYLYDIILSAYLTCVNKYVNYYYRNAHRRNFHVFFMVL